MTSPERDEEFEAYLQRRGSVHADLERIEQPEPPASVDALILKRARSAFARPQDGEVGFSTRFAPSDPMPSTTRRWAVPVGLAATILFSVVLYRAQPDAQQLAALRETRSPTPPRSSSPVMVDLQVAGEAENDVMLASTPGEAPADVSARAPTAALAKRANVVSDAAEIETAIASVEDRTEAAANGSSRQASSAAVSAAAPAPGPPPPPAVASSAEGSTVSSAAEAPPAQTSSASAAAAMPSARASAAPGAPPVAASSAGTQSSMARKSGAERAIAPKPHEPATWLKRIEALRAAGKSAEADDQLREFRRAYPDYVLDGAR